MTVLSELNTLSREALETRVREIREEMRRTRFGLASRTIKDVRRIRALRVELARIFTLLRSKRTT